MENNEFNDIIQVQIQRSTDVLIQKAADYATGGDRLHNFRHAAGLKGITMRAALDGMMLKHTVSIYDGTQDTALRPLDWWEEKITDHINYLLLLQAVVWEEHNEQADHTEEFLETLRQHGVTIADDGKLQGPGEQLTSEHPAEPRTIPSLGLYGGEQPNALMQVVQRDSNMATDVPVYAEAKNNEPGKSFVIFENGQVDLVDDHFLKMEKSI